MHFDITEVDPSEQYDTMVEKLVDALIDSALITCTHQYKDGIQACLEGGGAAWVVLVDPPVQTVWPHQNRDVDE